VERARRARFEEDIMRGRIVVWVAAVAMLALAAAARASQEGMLDRAELNEYAGQNKAVARFIKYNGYPDMAEVRPIKDQPPWDDHEVILYYIGMHKEISFARARVLGRPEVTSTRYERVLTDADVRALEAHGTKLNETKVASASTSTSSCTGNAAERAECAAGRAENAADRVEVAAVQAEKAADRTEAIVEKMVAPPSGARRHKN
jgi:hypothetical protein